MSPVNWKGYSTEDDPARAGRFAAWKGEKKYWITRCAPGMDQSRVNVIHQAFEKSVIPGGNLPEPVFLRDGAAWFCAEEDCPSLLDGYGAKAFMGLRPAHRQRIVFSAANALMTLHAAGLVHGSLQPASFRIQTAGDGSFRAILTDLFFAGPGRKESSISYPNGYRAPEVASGVLDRGTDSYAFGACVYFWLTGELPRYGENEQLVLPGSVPKAYHLFLSRLLRRDRKERPELSETFHYATGCRRTDRDRYLISAVDAEFASRFQADAKLLEERAEKYDPAFTGRLKNTSDW